MYPKEAMVRLNGIDIRLTDEHDRKVVREAYDALVLRLMQMSEQETWSDADAWRWRALSNLTDVLEGALFM